VTKITNFGVFVELEQGLEGLLHISELTDNKVDKPEAVVKQDQEIEVRVLRVDPAERKIGLSRRRVGEDEEKAAEETPEDTTSGTPKQPSPRGELRGGTGSGGDLIKMPEPSSEPKPE
jgi:small subunit ribosomal protein S1